MMPAPDERSPLLGLDVGSVGVKAAVVAADGRILALSHAPAPGDPAAALAEALEAVRPVLGGALVRVGVTGQGRGSLASLEGHAAENEMLCLVRGVAAIGAPVRAAIEIGGHIARWASLDRDAAGRPRLGDFSLNDQCAAGVGAFLAQQAGRLKMDLAEFARAAAAARAGARIAGRCAVFAKSDMIHLQQKGTPLDEIAYGLCLALARNFVATVLRGRESPAPIGLAGGGALNAGLVRAFREVLGLGADELLALPEALHVGALGAARLAAERAAAVEAAALLETLGGRGGRGRGTAAGAAGRPPAALGEVAPPSLRAAPGPTPCPPAPGPAAPEALVAPPPSGPVRAYLGVDLGSVSTDFALVAADGAFLDGVYLPTRGRPVEVLGEGLGILGARYGERLTVLGLGTTGSGRYLAARLLGADLVKNEITAQLAGALHFFADADTIFEIGGQDSKYIRVEGGRLADFTMNKVCAAGTGSFLEEQCEHLGLDVKRDFAPLAARAGSPADLGARCTVFMETEIVSAVARGTHLPDLVAGLADSVARNYLQKVVGFGPVGRRIVFQGGVASNGAVVAAFERLLGRPVVVHPHNGLSGAIGVALLTRAAARSGPSAFKGFGAVVGPHRSRTFECRRCENRCEVTRIEVGGARVHFGDTCERYTIGDSAGESRGAAVPNLFAEREALWLASVDAAAAPAGRGRGVIGLPRASILFEYLPFWAAFFGRLGFRLVLSPPTGMKTLELGTRHLPAETCLPIKLAFGHVAALRQAGVDAVFLPSPVAVGEPAGRTAYVCPYTQAAPFMARAAMPDPILAPEIPFESGFREFAGGMAPAAAALGIGPDELPGAFEAAEAALAEFRRRLRERGAELLASGFDRALAVFGRPYNLFDAYLNLSLAQHFARLGVLAFPQSFLPADGIDLARSGHDLPWRFPRDAMRAALWAAGDPRLNPVLVTNFGCGPDAFLQKHMEAALADRHMLVLEFDEHRGEAGMVTRIEAYLDQVSERRARVPRGEAPAPEAGGRPSLAGRRVYVPYFSDHAFVFQGMLRQIGADAELLPLPDEAVRVAGEGAGSGKECHAYAMLLGDLLRIAEQAGPGGDPAIYFYPGTSAPCLLAQFADGFRIALEQRGVAGVAAFAPGSREIMEIFGFWGIGQLFRGLVATDLLLRWLCENRPYELDPGSADRAHRDNLADLSNSLAENDLGGFLGRAVERMEAVRVDRSERRPLVGVAGDIYTRANRAANLGLFAKLEALGCEVWPAPCLVDSVDFGLSHEFGSCLRAGRYQEALATGLLMLRRDANAWRVRRRLSGLLSRSGEPGHAEVMRLASPYVGPGSQNLLLLNVAKMVDFARRGADGVVNAMCLNCMFGTASAALIERIRRDHGGIPIVSLVYGGTETPALRTKIETFVHQVRAFRESRRRKTSDAGRSRPHAVEA